MVDFTDCRVDKLRAYGGSNGNKICIFYNSERYMLKFPPIAKNNPNMSYSNGCINEHLASSIYKTLGIPVHDTILGTYNRDNKEKVVVACKDFCTEGKELFSFGQIKNTCIDSDSSSNGFGTELGPVLEAIEQQEFVDPMLMKERFWDMFVADAFLGNFDRHNGNWGVLVNHTTGEAELAPVFDNGSCLYPQLTEDNMKMILASRAEIEKRIFVFPSSALKINNKKISYVDFLKHADDEVCLHSFSKIYQSINFSKIDSVIAGLPISGVMQSFYSTMLRERKALILDAAWESMRVKPTFSVTGMLDVFK